jgi:2-desacetyl-2-hydroxyethyl bacteriochlorophyllide A dehydrogenase
MHFLSPKIVFTRPGQVELQENPPRELPLKPGEVTLRTEYSIISPATELACMDGLEAWAPLPFTPGYGSVGRVTGFASDVQGLKVGQRIFTYGPHSRDTSAWPFAIKLSDAIDPIKATFGHMAAISITALRVSEAEPGDTVAIFGLGLVGNLAAQFFQLAGCEVIGIDLSPRRRETAQQCGIGQVLSPSENLREQVSALTGGEMCHTVVEATGIAAVAAQASDLAAKLGEVILLGSPRAEFQANLTPFLNRTHTWDRGCVSLKGAHEWRYPILEDKAGHGRHSIERNLRYIMKLIEQDRLKLSPLITHVLSPADCGKAYAGLRHDKDAYNGVVFDWSKI